MGNFSNQLDFGNIEKMVDKDVRITISDMTFEELTHIGQISQANSSFIISAPQKEDKSGDTGYYGLFIADYNGNITSILPFNKINDNHFTLDYDENELKLSISYSYISNLVHSEFDGNINEMKNTLNIHTSYIDNLQDTVNRHNTYLNNLDNRLNTLSETVTNNKQNLDRKISDIENSLQTTYDIANTNTSNIRNNSNRINQANEAIISCYNQITELQEQVTYLTETINLLTSRKYYAPDNNWIKEGNYNNNTYLLTINETKLNQYVNTYENTYGGRNNSSMISDIINQYPRNEELNPNNSEGWEYSF